MSPKTILTALALTLSLTACATPYGAKGMFGGFEEARLDGNTYRVHFQGNGFTSKQKVETYTLVRCAELTTEGGFDYFVIVDQGTESKDTQIHSGSFNSSSSTGGGAISEYGTVSTWQNTSGWTSPSTSSSIRKYDSAVMIKMFKGEKPADAMNAYCAEEVLTYLGPQVGKKG